MRLLTEAIDDLTFVIIEVAIPAKDAEFQTIIQIHGTDESILKSGQSSILGIGEVCGMCGGSGMVKIGDAIDKRIAQPYAKRSDLNKIARLITEDPDIQADVTGPRNLLTHYDDTLLAMAEIEGEGWLDRQFERPDEYSVPGALKEVQRKQREFKEWQPDPEYPNINHQI